jgi:hypothetical protein
LTNKSNIKIVEEIIELLEEKFKFSSDNQNRDLGVNLFLYKVKDLYRKIPFLKDKKHFLLDMNKRPSIKKRTIKNDVSKLESILEIDRGICVRQVEINTFKIFKETL